MNSTFTHSMGGLRDIVTATGSSATDTESPKYRRSRQIKQPPPIPTRPLSTASHSSSSTISGVSTITSPTSHGTGTAIRAAKLPDIVCDAIFENQRGTSLFGAPRFGKRSLLPTDFPAYSDRSGGFVVELKLYQCRPTWEWVSDWMVDMNGDVDQEGWSYSLQFTSDKWSGACRTSHYVRRRKWIRMRRMKGASGSATASSPSVTPITPTGGTLSGAHSIEDVIGKMQRGRIDRERIVDLKSYLLLVEDVIVPPSKVQLLMAQCDHECSKLQAALLFAPQMDMAQEEAIVAALQSLRFYSDRVMFLSSNTTRSKQLFKSVIQGQCPFWDISL
ncbi:hypothetical protein BASA82_000380 [Batrachochytrium salamandrivorans]|nr:hypothetical protein BASA82_000380 [Batrachochytrium salamandrivorans]